MAMEEGGDWNGTGSHSRRKSEMRKLAYSARIAILCITPLVAVSPAGAGERPADAALGGAAVERLGKAVGTPAISIRMEGKRTGKNAGLVTGRSVSQSCFDGCRSASTQCNRCVSAPGPFCGPGEDACIASCPK